MQYPDSDLDCAAVCGDEVRIYGALDKRDSTRPFIRLIVLRNFGQALSYAQDFDDKQRENRPAPRK